MIEEEQLSLNSQLTQQYPIQSRRSKQNNKFKVYKCICKLKTHDKIAMMKHKLKCQVRKFTKNRLLHCSSQLPQSIKESQTIINSSINHQQLQNIKMRLTNLQGKSNNIHQVQAINTYKRAQQIVTTYKQTILNIIISKLAFSFQNASKSKINLTTIHNSASAGVLGKIYALNFDDCVELISDKLAAAHKIVMEQAQNRSSKTRKSNQNAFHFISQFSQFELHTQFRLIDELANLLPTQRKNICRYFAQIQKYYPYFSKFPSPPKLFKTVPRSIMLSNVSIEEVGDNIKTIYLHNKQLACDVWMIVTMGLRFRDLLKLFFQTNQGYTKFIKLKQNKNNNIAIRYIPKSLIQMVYQSKTIYPATQRRLQTAVKYCLANFKSSYGFKHRAITSIIRALHQANPLARMHSQPQMTSRHYINLNDTVFIDNAFTIGISFKFSQEQRHQIDGRNIQLDLTHQSPFINVLDNRVSKQITIQSENYIKSRLQSSAVDGILQIQDLNQFQVTEQEKLQLIQINTISKNHQVELQNFDFRNIQEAIASLDAENLVITATQILVQETGQDFSSQIIAEKLAEASGRDVQYYEFKSGQEIFHYQAISQDQSDDLPIVISKRNQSFSISSFQEGEFKTRTSALIAREKLSSSILHRPFPPNCPKCKQLKAYMKLQTTQEGIQCFKCNWKIHKQVSVFPLKDSITITSTNDEFLEGYASLNADSKKNNLIQFTEKQFKGKLSFVSKYSADIPLKIQSTFKEATPRFGKQIQKNRKFMQYLPLVIKQSSIPNAGFGIFSTCKIAKDKLILTYVGVIGTSFSIHNKEDNDSLFSIGWVSDSKKNVFFELISDGKIITGPARYINSSSSKQSQNVCVITTIYKGQLIVGFISAKQISDGEQLLFYYGKKYWTSFTCQS